MILEHPEEVVVVVVAGATEVVELVPTFVVCETVLTEGTIGAVVTTGVVVAIVVVAATGGVVVAVAVAFS